MVPFYTLNFIGFVMCSYGVKILNGRVPDVAFSKGLIYIYTTI